VTIKPPLDDRHLFWEILPTGSKVKYQHGSQTGCWNYSVLHLITWEKVIKGQS